MVRLQDPSCRAASHQFAQAVGGRTDLIWGPAAGALLVCHGTYGFLWVYKNIFYGDPGWQRPCGFVGALSVFIYPLAPWAFTTALCSA